jgi:biopolymer transport protein ExbB
MNELTVHRMIVNGWPMLSILAFTSILSIAVMWERFVLLRRARLNANLFVKNVLEIISQRGAAVAITYCERFSQPVSTVAQAILLEGGDREARERAGRYALQTRIEEMEEHVAILGTIGGVAPFLGLMGTVIGIIKAFMDVAMHSGGGLEVVSSGIGEALITTAVGLFVAIPAVVGYNYCVNRIRRLTGEIDLAVHPLTERGHTGGGAAQP